MVTRVTRGRPPAGTVQRRANKDASSAFEPQRWKLRFAHHIGFPDTDRPAFKYTLGTADPVANIDFMASLGFAGVLDNNIKYRPRREQDRIARAIDRHGMELGCFVNQKRPYTIRWGSNEPGMREAIVKEVKASVELARRINGRNIVVVTERNRSLPLWWELGNLIDNLRAVRSMVEKAGLVLVVEHVNQPRRPDNLVTRLGEAHLVVKALDTPAVKLMYDTEHVSVMDGHLINNVDRVAGEIGSVQVADIPGRLEPGQGEINFAPFFRKLKSVRYRGLVELEHNYSDDSAAGELAAYEELCRINAAV
jgi:hydroxypyruvate isomerase